jgi:glutamate-ammonia-ligase adenylyltransferase
LHDQQTHSLPSGKDLERVALAMGHNAAEDLLAGLAAVRSEVNGLFRLQFQPTQEQQDADHWQDHWRQLANRDPGTAPGGEISAVMARFLERLGRQSMSQRAAQRLHGFMPMLLQQLAEREPDEAVLADILELVLSITRRSAYLSLLVHNPLACKRMIVLFEESAWLAQTVIRHPALLDELLDPSLGQLLPDRAELQGTTRRIQQSHEDPEAVLQGLNHFKQATSLRVAVAEIETALSAEEVQYTLTDLAEALLGVCLDVADSEVRARYDSVPATPLCVIGYGSLGAREVGYGSDLDLIFLFDPDPATPGEAGQSIPVERFYTRVARRLISLLNIPTASGRLYETDTRLRPNGRSGLLVSSVQAFETYQREKAWTWELQSLTRARALAGNPLMHRRFERIRLDVLAQDRDPDTLRRDIAQMRRRMRSEFKDKDRFKQGRGGLVDIDFLAQLGILEQAGKHPSLLAATGTRDQLVALADCGWIEKTQAEALCEAREALCRARHLASIARQADRYPPETAASEAICREILGAYAEPWFSDTPEA